MSLPQPPSATYFGGLTNNPNPSLNPYAPNSLTEPSFEEVMNYKRPKKLTDRLKRKWRGEFDNVAQETRFTKILIFGGIFICLGIIAAIVAPIGVYYHAPEHRIGKRTPTITPTPISAPQVNYTGPANVVVATIPGASADGDDIDVMAVEIPKSESEAKTKSDTTQVLHSRALRTRTGLAPPFFDSCKINQDCDWGYRCIENTCYPGCDSDNDCRKEHKCGHWKHDGPSDMYCMVKPHKDCRLHLDFCATGHDCCSGRCERVNGKKWRLCVPGIGRLDDSDLGLEGGEV